MKEQEAIAILEKVTEQISAVKAVHIQIEQALNCLKARLIPPVPVKEPEGDK